MIVLIKVKNVFVVILLNLCIAFVYFVSVILFSKDTIFHCILFLYRPFQNYGVECQYCTISIYRNKEILYKFILFYFMNFFKFINKPYTICHIVQYFIYLFLLYEFILFRRKLLHYEFIYFQSRQISDLSSIILLFFFD